MQNAKCKLRISRHTCVCNLQFAIWGTAGRVVVQCAFCRWLLALLMCAVEFGLASTTFANEPLAQPAAESNVKTAPGAETHGISLGDYRIRSYYPVDAQKGTVRFT